MRDHTKIYALFKELSKIKWDITDLSEIKRKRGNRIQLLSGNIFYFEGNPEDTKN